MSAGNGRTPNHHRVLIVGGGAAGLTVAAQLRKRDRAVDTAIIEPSDKHYYQPLWTLVGAGCCSREITQRNQADLIPGGVTWIRDAVKSFDPDKNAVETTGGKRYSYDYLIVAAGIQVDWGKVKGLQESIGKAGVCSNYSYDTVGATWPAIESLSGGNAVFTHPATPIKCGGGPQKIMYLAEDALQRRGIAGKVKFHFYSGEAAIFKCEKYAQSLMKVIARKQITPHFKHSLKEVRVDSHEAIFDDIDGKTEIVQKFDMLHVTPPMSSPDFLKTSPLANAGGWVDVDKATLRHVKFANIFALGDCSSLPTSKTAAAIRKQAPVVTDNVLAAIHGKSTASTYDGYTACPIPTGYGRLILAEFDYDLKPQESFPFDQSKERWSMYMLKRHVLPPLYWHGMIKGRA